MSERIVIYYQSGDQSKRQRYDWLIINDKGTIGDVNQCDTIHQLSLHCKQREVTLIIPGNEVLLTAIKLNAANYRQVRKAIPYALEEQLASDIEKLHFAIGKKMSGNHYPVAVIEKAVLQKKLLQLKQANIYPDRIIIDTQAAPYSKQQWTILIESEYSIIKTSAHTGCVVETNQLINMLNLLANDNKESMPDTIKLINLTKDNCITQTIRGLFSCTIDEEKSAQSSLIYFAKTILTQSDFINLLQNEFKQRKRINYSKKIWLAASVLAILGLTIPIVGTVASYFYLDHKNKALNKEISSLYYQLFPKASSVVAPRIQVERRLQTLQQRKNDHGLLALLANIGSIIKHYPTIHINRLDYHNKQLNLSITSNNFKNLGIFIGALKQANLLVKQSSVSDNNKSVNAELIIQEQKT